ncbi:uncharacterized protein C4orf17 homolog [Heteronotia binoei]|uniref:uncharacterized protein C4orf17 homolog n=1 Tax=Heteronotia binoei TaxID=13085 RepID=UPI00292F9DFC|nr:uncharacterized protein C4orf17 homolog [Heteronotia binoei]
MHINFRAQPDPLVSPRGSIKPGFNEEKSTYFVCRNNPHPRTVCHMKGLNDVPVCVVKDPGYIAGHFIMPKIEQSPSTTRTRGSVTIPGTTTTTLQSLINKRNSFPQPTSLYDQSDLQRKYIPEQPQNMPVSETLALSPTLALRHRPEVMEDINYTSTYLDHEIKVLEKLRDILQTDSLGEIKEWLSKASLHEKEFVSNFIRSDITTRDLLNYHQKHGQSGSEAVHLTLQALLKDSKAAGSTGEEKLVSGRAA